MAIGRRAVSVQRRGDGAVAGSLATMGQLAGDVVTEGSAWQPPRSLTSPWIAGRDRRHHVPPDVTCGGRIVQQKSPSHLTPTQPLDRSRSLHGGPGEGTVCSWPWAGRWLKTGCDIHSASHQLSSTAAGGGGGGERREFEGRGLRAPHSRGRVGGVQGGPAFSSWWGCSRKVHAVV